MHFQCFNARLCNLKEDWKPRAPATEAWQWSTEIWPDQQERYWWSVWWDSRQTWHYQLTIIIGYQMLWWVSEDYFIILKKKIATKLVYGHNSIPTLCEISCLYYFQVIWCQKSCLNKGLFWSRRFGLSSLREVYRWTSHTTMLSWEFTLKMSILSHPPNS